MSEMQTSGCVLLRDEQITYAVKKRYYLNVTTLLESCNEIHVHYLIYTKNSTVLVLYTVLLVHDRSCGTCY